ncbi:hypothetical protein SLEP1_g10733 [Rubroshorea leprosula]|uniref:Transposase (putative) gypsy type domain-containing protein n=1 Tax=Rubroshorea leprosula TaxID=152421 RepID=A0AAV5IHI8_9ROSI|nr:hypothetical protein SLEP1_g10733 [Rubroshorea leprosula]
MDYVREVGELRGNQGIEEEEHVMSVESIAMIVLPELRDLLETLTSESSASLSAQEGDDHHTSSSSSSSFEETPSREEEMGNVVGNEPYLPVVREWENKAITGRLSNLRKAPKDLPSRFRFRVALHHEVVDSTPSISGYKKLKEMTGWIPVYVDHFDASLRFPLPGLIFDLLADYELALTQLTPNSIRFIIGFMLLCARLEVPAKVIVFRSLFQCRLCPNSRGAKWYYLSGREKSQLFKNVRNKVARWKRQFVFVRDTRTYRINNDLAAWLSEWRIPNAHVNYPQLLPRDTDIKNQLLEYARRKNLIDLEALVTSERNEQHLGEAAPTSLGFPSSSHRGPSSASRPCDEQRVEVVAPSTCKRACEEIDSEDEVPLMRRRTSLGAQPAQAAQTTAACSSNPPSTTVRAAAEPTSASTSLSAPRIAYLEGFNYVKTNYQPAMVQGMQSSVPPVDRQRARIYVQQHGGQVAMIKLMDNNELSANCKQLAVEKASLVDDVNRLQGLEMANRAASAESKAEELASRNNELREELERARAEKECEIQAARNEAARVEERAKKAEAERDHTLNELGSLRNQVAEATKNLNDVEEALNELKTSHRRSISIARAHGAEWLVGSAAFQDAVAVASANMTMEIYGEICEKVLQHRPDFPIGELAFFDGRTSTSRGAPVAEPESSNTPPNSQPTMVPTGTPATAPAHQPTAQPSPARAEDALTDASMPST